MTKKNEEEQKYSYLYKPDIDIQNMIVAIRCSQSESSILTTKEAIDLAIKTYYEEMIACKSKDIK